MVLELRHSKVRLVDLYASLRVSTQDWIDLNAALKRIRAKEERTHDCLLRYQCELLIVETYCQTRRGNALQTMIKPLYQRDNRAAECEVGKRLPSSRRRQKREGLFILRAPKGVTHLFPEKDGSMAGSIIDLMLISGYKGKFPSIPIILTSPAAFARDLPASRANINGAR